MNCANSLTFDMNSISLKLVKPNSRVLDLGCGNGYLGDHMKKNLNCFVVGAEINPELAKKAGKKLDLIIGGNIEHQEVLSQIKKAGPFDIIFASGILEHLVDPQRTLENLAKLIKKGGFILITLPNIAHWFFRLSLLKGEFDYAESGVLDKTHLHLYTINTAKALISNSNLYLEHIDFEFTQLPLLHRFLNFLPFGIKIHQRFLKLFPEIFAYQILLKVRPKKSK